MQTPYPLDAEPHSSSGSSGRVRGAEKHEIYAAAFGGHLFYDLFLQGLGGPWPPRPPRSATAFPLECRPPLPLGCRPPSPWMQTPSPWMIRYCIPLECRPPLPLSPLKNNLRKLSLQAVITGQRIPWRLPLNRAPDLWFSENLDPLLMSNFHTFPMMCDGKDDCTRHRIYLW